jgi:hypothetical protein
MEKDLTQKIREGKLSVEEYIKLFTLLEKKHALDKTQVELIHKHLYRIVILISDLNGGMIKLSEAISVNQAVKIDNYEVSDMSLILCRSSYRTCSPMVRGTLSKDSVKCLTIRKYRESSHNSS